MNLFLPDLAVDSYKELDLAALKAAGIRLLLCDVDNTISVLGDTACHDDVTNFLHKVKASGLDVVLFTNNTRAHALRVLHGKPDVPLRTFVCKPLPFSIWRVLLEKRLAPSQAAVFGDQLFTDILGGSLAGVKTILSAPLSEKERKDTQFLRRLEERVYASLERKGKLKREGHHVRIL